MVIWICRYGKHPLVDFQVSFARMPHSSRQRVFQHYIKQMYCFFQRTGWMKNALAVGGWHEHLKMGCILLLPTAMVSNVAFSSVVVVASLIQTELFRTTLIVAMVLSMAKLI